MARLQDPGLSPVGLPTELMSRVKRIHLRTHRLVNTALSGGYRSTFRGSGIEFEDVRPYQPGDDVRRIDWNVTARSGEPFVKSFREERELTVVLLVDTSATMDFGSARWTKRESAAQLCSLIAMVAMRHQDRVGLELFGSGKGLHLPPRKGGRHVLRLIREVLAAPPGATRESALTEVLENQARVQKQRSMMFVVSDFVGGDDSAGAAGSLPDWSEALARLNARHDVICVRVVDPLEERLPKAGLVRLREVAGAGVIEVDSSSKAVRAAWEARAAARRASFEAGLRRARADSFELRTDGDLAQPLARFFHRRENRFGGRP